MNSSFMQAETNVREEDEKKINNTSETDCHAITTGVNLENQLPKLEDQSLKEEELDNSGSQIGGKPLISRNFPDE